VNEYKIDVSVGLGPRHYIFSNFVAQPEEILEKSKREF